jgi:hypothetical protein
MTSTIPQRMKRRERLDVEQRNRYTAWFEDVTSFGRRVLTTVLFTDIVGSTGKVIELGDRGGAGWSSGIRPVSASSWLGSGGERST